MKVNCRDCIQYSFCETMEELPSKAEYHNEEYRADVDQYGNPDEQEECVDWYDGDDYSEGLE